MALDKRKPPEGTGRLSDGDVLADGFDALDINFRVHPRKRAASPRSFGPEERVAARACRERRTKSTDDVLGDGDHPILSRHWTGFPALPMSVTAPPTHAEQVAA